MRRQLRQLGAAAGGHGRALVVAGLLAAVVLMLVWTRHGIKEPYERVSIGGRGAGGQAGGGGGSAEGIDDYARAARRAIVRYRNTRLSQLVPLLDSGINGSRGFTMADWQLFEPFIDCPPGRPLRRYGGTDDGAKLVCDVKPLPRGCVIYSMGSAGNYVFEQAMLNETVCEVHTFDCTVKGRSLSPGRHSYHDWCLGDPRLRPGLRPWANVTASLGHKRVDLLKLDIEGHEYPLLASLQQQPDEDASKSQVLPGALPGEILIEIHSKMNGAWKRTHLEGSWQNGVPMPHGPIGLSLVFMHLAQLGYGIYSQEVNKDWYMCCSEFSLLRVPSAAAAP